MRNLTNTPSVVPATDATVHLVLDDFGKLGLSYRETDVAEADERSVIDAMIDGQYKSPVQIVAFNVAEGWARDVSEDMASAIIDAARKRKTWLSKNTREFIERHTGHDAPADLIDQD